MARTCIYAPDWSKNGANTAWGALVYKDSDGYHEAQCNATSGFLALFLCSGKTYTELTGMTWDKGSYPAVSGKDYSYEMIEAACNGYKITKVYNKLFK